MLVLEAKQRLTLRATKLYLLIKLFKKGSICFHSRFIEIGFTGTFLLTVLSACLPRIYRFLFSFNFHLDI